MQSGRARVEERARKCREKVVVIWSVTMGTLPVPRPPSISHRAWWVHAERLFCSASVQLALECLSITSIASSPSTQITRGTALSLLFSSNLWQVLKGGSRGPFTSGRRKKLFSLKMNKARRLQEGENMVIKVPTVYLLGVQLICYH